MTSAPVLTTKEDALIAGRASESVRSRESDFALAKIHSAKVRRLKWLLPILGAACALAFGAYTFLSRVPQLTYDIASTAFTDGKLVMANPKLNGVTKDNLPYALTAAQAIQDPLTQSIIELHGIDAKVPIDAKDSAVIKADRGVYDSKANTLVIGTPMTVEATNGLVARLKSARLEIDGGSMRTADPVEITQNGNRITADTFSILENGKVLVFEKRVRVHVQPAPEKAQRAGEQNASN